MSINKTDSDDHVLNPIESNIKQMSERIVSFQLAELADFVWLVRCASVFHLLFSIQFTLSNGLKMSPLFGRTVLCLLFRTNERTKV